MGTHDNRSMMVVAMVFGERHEKGEEETWQQERKGKRNVGRRYKRMEGWRRCGLLAISLQGGRIPAGEDCWIHPISREKFLDIAMW